MCQECDPPPGEERGLGDVAAAKGLLTCHFCTRNFLPTWPEPGAGRIHRGAGSCHQRQWQIFLSPLAEDAEIHLAAHPTSEGVCQHGEAEPGLHPAHIHRCHGGQQQCLESDAPFSCREDISSRYLPCFSRKRRGPEIDLRRYDFFCTCAGCVRNDGNDMVFLAFADEEGNWQGCHMRGGGGG